MPWYAGIIFRILTYLRMQCTAVHQFRVVVTVYVCAAVFHDFGSRFGECVACFCFFVELACRLWQRKRCSWNLMDQESPHVSYRYMLVASRPPSDTFRSVRFESNSLLGCVMCVPWSSGLLRVAAVTALLGFIWRCLFQVITGHSERRVGFGSEGESSALVADKTKVRLILPSYHCLSVLIVVPVCMFFIFVMCVCVFFLFLVCPALLVLGALISSCWCGCCLSSCPCSCCAALSLHVSLPFVVVVLVITLLFLFPSPSLSLSSRSSPRYLVFVLLRLVSVLVSFNSIAARSIPCVLCFMFYAVYFSLVIESTSCRRSWVKTDEPEK